MPPSTAPRPGLRVALTGESRGEFLFLAHVADRIDDVLGRGAAVNVVMDPRDLSASEREGCLLPTEAPEFRDAIRLSDAELATRIAECEVEFGIPNLRRLWLSDLAAWRDGVPDPVLARRAIGYLRVFDRLFSEHPGLDGGFAEESGRLIKRSFRAVARHHDRRALVALNPLLPGRVLLVDQEDLRSVVTGVHRYEESEADMAVARALIASVRAGSRQFAEPRDLSMNAGRLRNFAALTVKQLRNREPGASNVHLRTFAVDYASQRARTALLGSFATELPASGPAIFYPLHTPRDSQITIRGEPFRDQIWIIEYLLNSLPHDAELWVKPHPAATGQVQVARLAALRSRHDRLRVIRPTVHAHAVIQASDAVVTVNSTAGFEALMFGRPLVTLGESLYRGAGLTTDVVDLQQLPLVLGAIRHQAPASERGVERLFAYFQSISHEAALLHLDAGPENGARIADALVSELGLEARR